MNDKLRTLTLLLSLFVLFPKAKKTASDLLNEKEEEVETVAETAGISGKFIRSLEQAKGFAKAFATKAIRNNYQSWIMTEPEKRMFYSFKVSTGGNLSDWQTAGTHYWNKFAKYNIL